MTNAVSAGRLEVLDTPSIKAIGPLNYIERKAWHIIREVGDMLALLGSRVVIVCYKCMQLRQTNAWFRHSDK